MRRTSSQLVAFGAVWLVALVVVIIVAIFAGWPVTARGYLAGWLVATSLPLGALPVLMVHDLYGAAETPVSSMLRLLLASLPLLAVLFVPVLFDLSGVFPWPADSHLAGNAGAGLKGFGKQWYMASFFVIRAVVYLAIWVVLSLFFVRQAPRSERQSTVAGVGLALHCLVGTLAAYDWWMSLDMAFMSSAYGVLVIFAQAAFAMCVASLAVLIVERELPPERSVIIALLSVLFIAAFVQFTQFLVVWSANLPKEIVWYQTRWVGALGPIFVVAAPFLLMFAYTVLIPASLAAIRGLAIAALACVLLLAFVDLACLASPRNSFTFGGLSLVLAFLIVVGGLGASCAALLGGRLVREFRNG